MNPEEMLGDTWDLVEVLTDREQPVDKVDVYLNEKASYAKAALLEAHGKTADGDAMKLIEDELEQIDADLEASKYVIHISAIPSRMREDIASKALHEHPMKLNMLGQDDPDQMLARKRLESDMLWAAQIIDVVNPRGQHKQNWTLEEIRGFSNSLPTAAQRAIDAALQKLTRAAEQFTVNSKSPDF